MAQGICRSKSHQNVPRAVVMVTRTSERLYASGADGDKPYKRRFGRKKIPVCPSPRTGNPAPMCVDQNGNSLACNFSQYQYFDA